MTAPSPAAAAAGEAGRRGEDVRSDLHVVVEAGGDGLDLEVVSRVQALYGDDIRATVARPCRRWAWSAPGCGSTTSGAVPWVIAARVEAAARAAGLVRGPATEAAADATAERASRRERRDRLRRSRLYLPGNEPKFMLNAGLHAPDAVILDLEDSVHPRPRPPPGCWSGTRCASWIFHGAERMVRINQLPLGLEDLDAIVPEART
jgi:citrate lyase subunit beta / citryl-CoA lyase